MVCGRSMRQWDLSSWQLSLIQEIRTRLPFNPGRKSARECRGHSLPSMSPAPTPAKNVVSTARMAPALSSAVFAREVTPAVIQLLKMIDNATAINREQGLGSYVVFCSDAEGLGRQLQDIAQKEKFQHIVLTLYKAGGPEKYRLAPAADVTENSPSSTVRPHTNKKRRFSPQLSKSIFSLPAGKKGCQKFVA